MSDTGYDNITDNELFSLITPAIAVGDYQDELFDAIALQELYKELDRTSGAPFGVRANVGAAQTPGDKLATLRLYYPDAIPVEQFDPENGAAELGYGNFIYRDPETKKLTLYDEFNPKLLGLPIPTLRDIFADAGPEVAETVGAVGGFIGGGIGGAYATAPTMGVVNPITGAIVGEGVGSATLRELYIGAFDTFGETIDTRSLGQRATDFTFTATFNAAAGPIISQIWKGTKFVAGQPIRYMFGGTDSKAKDTLEAFQSLGISNPPSGAVVGNPTMLQIEQGLYALPTSTTNMHANAAQTISEIDFFARELAERYGGVRTRDEAAIALQSAAQAARSRYTNEVDRLYSLVDEAMPPNLSSPAANTAAFIEKYSPVVKTETGKEIYGSVFELAKKVLKDAEAGNLNYVNLKNFRSALRENLSSATSAGARPDAQTVKLQELYAAVTKDLNELVDSVPDVNAQRLFKDANNFVLEKQGDFGSITFLDEVLKKGGKQAGNVLDSIVRGADKGADDLLKLKEAFNEDEFNILSGYMLGRLGMPTPGARVGTQELGQELIIKEGAEFIGEQSFSPRTFVSNYRKLSKEAKDVLFRGTEHEDLIPELDNLVFVADKIAESAEKMANPSGTTRTLTSVAFITGAGGAGAGLGFDYGISALVAPWLSSKLFTNKNFVRWLAEGMEISAYNPNSFGQHVRRLYTIYETNPEIRDEVRAILHGLEHQTIEPIEEDNAENVPPATTAAPNEQAFREVTNAEVAGKLLPDIELAEQVVEFSPPQVSDPEVVMSPSVLPDEADREIAMRQQTGGIGSLA